MSKTKITWTDETWNPVTGCSKVSQGCKHCYAEREWPRLSVNPKSPYHGREFTDVACHPDRLDAPLRWKKPRMVFVNSMSDLFHEDVPDEFIDRVFAVMAFSSRHTFQVLTKRPERMRDYFAKLTVDHLKTVAKNMGHLFDFPSGFEILPIAMPYDHCFALSNVWLGVSAEDQETANYRIPHLLHTPAAVHFVSAEPLIGPVDLTRVEMPDGDYLGPSLNNWGSDCGIDWVIVGCESGAKARPMDLGWAKSLVAQCKASKRAKVFVKQIPLPQALSREQSGTFRVRIGTPIKDVMLFPEDLQFQEFPTVYKGGK